MTKNSYELFYRAVSQNDISRTKLILEEAMKDPRFNIDEINEEGLTALQFSCFAGNLDIVKMLVSSRANWKIQDREGHTLLHAAAMSGHVEVTKYLLGLGIKPIVKTDNGLMPIDITDNISVIVVLLRAMLDQGYLYEMQDYMLDHPKLKRKIFRELELVKCKEKEKNEILKELPYTPHATRRNYNHFENESGLSRSLSTFTALSTSTNNLNAIEQTNLKSQRHPSDSHLHRQDSLNSLSSKSSRSSHNSIGGILKNSDNAIDTHSSTQQYLENRFPPVSKSVTFELDLASSKDLSSAPRSRASSYDSLEQLGATEAHVDDSIYENIVRKSNTLSPISENYQQNLINANAPPPLPPREPTNVDQSFFDNYYERNKKVDDTLQFNDRQFGSETDSGIDINETQGRIFALSLEDKKLSQSNESFVANSYSESQKTFSQPIGLFYSRDKQTAVVKQQVSSDDNLPCGFFIRTTLKTNPKHMSWNGRSLQKELDQLQPWYNSHIKSRNSTSTDKNFQINSINERTEDSFKIKHSEPDGFVGNDNYSNKERVRALSTGNIYNGNTVFMYNFDHQPDIML